MGREEVKRALVEASIALFSERGIRAVPIRDIAQQANVNSALIYRHFGSKEKLVEATVAELAERMEPVSYDEDATGTELLHASFQMIRRNPEVFRILAYLALEKTDASVFAKLRSPALDHMVCQIAADQKTGDLYDGVDPKVLLASSYAFGLGWHIFRPMLLAMAGIPKSKERKVRSEIFDLWSDAITR